MGKPLMLREADDDRIEMLKQRTGARTKIDVVRSALDLLQEEVDRAERIARWQQAVRHVKKESRAVLKEFQSGSRLRRLK
ncbi:MAG: hypothetical protein ACT4O1_04455 [Gemmatimonadota bacterium]